MYNKRCHGFTLIELLVVIAIIAILAAILFPVFLHAKERSNQVKCLNNLKQLSTAVMTYRNDYNGRMPSAGMWTGLSCPDWCGSNGTGVPIYPERGSIFPYTRTRGIYVCGSDKTKPAQYALNSRGEWPLSYSMNYELYDVNVDSGWTKPVSKCLLFIHEARWSINDGLFRPLTDDISNAHYNGTDVVYVDGHACWKSQDTLRTEKANLWWTMRSGYR
jgi:prepilin-type N-terminal cleavage/methylation domain-containing protein